MKELIAIYLPSLRGGGAERIMVTLANDFSERGFRVDLVLANGEGPYLDVLSERVRIIDLKSARVLMSLPRLACYLRRELPSAMLTALSHANLVAIAARWLSRAPTRLVVSEHSHFSSSMSESKSIRACALVLLARCLYPKTDEIVAVSRGAASDLIQSLRLPLERVKTIYNPIVNSTMLELSRQPLVHPWFGSDEPPVVLGVGRLTVSKDFPLLIRAFAKLRAQRAVRLMILGEGELRLELEALVRDLGLEEDVALPGFVNNPYMYMRHAALYVLTSKWEGFGNVLVEAMACGTPVVATDCSCGPAEILENGRWGRLVPVGDVDALAHAMVETLTEPTHPDVNIRAIDFGVNQAVTEYLQALFPDHGRDNHNNQKRTFN